MVKTALKLLLVFVEYSESNTPLLIEAITSVDTKRGINSLTRHQLLRNIFPFIMLALLLFTVNVRFTAQAHTEGWH